MTRGYPWQQVLGHRVELAVAPSGEGIAIWGAAHWDVDAWGAGWPPPFTDITPAVLSCHTSTGADGLALASGVGTCELELLDLDGDLAPGGDVDWLLGHHLRVWVTPIDQADHPAWYGVIDKASAGGSFAVPIVSITAYDVRSLVAAVETPGPIANQAEPASTRLRAILDAAGFPPPTVLVEDDPSPLVADETVELGDLLSRTVESTGGLAWADGNGAIVTRNRDWVHGTAAGPSLCVYAGQPPSPPGVTIAQTTDLSASEAVSMVRNHVTWKNRADPPVEVIRLDADSITRYGMRRSTTSDLACDELALVELADRDLELHATPALVCEGATVTVYDQDTAQAAGLALGDLIVIGRNNPDGAQWQLTGVVAGIDLDITADSFEVALTALETGATLAAESGLWDEGDWDGVRWSTRPIVGALHLGPSDSDQLDAGYVLG